MRAFETPSYAKINLFLSIKGTRPDGYHELEMVNAKLSLCDNIRITLAPDEGIRLTVSDPSVPSDERNTAHQAAQRFFHHIEEPSRVDIHIEKRIPHGAGLGGGSSNAAAALLLLNRLYENPLTSSELHQIGASIGADVPFFLEPGCCYVSGIGENVSRLQLGPKARQAPISVVICSPNVVLNTGGAYGLWDRSDVKPQASPESMLQALNEGDWTQVIQRMFNSFETVIFPAYPEVRNAYEVFRETSPTPPRLSGSGSNLFSLHESPHEAETVVQKMKQLGYHARAFYLCLSND